MIKKHFSPLYRSGDSVSQYSYQQMEKSLLTWMEFISKKNGGEDDLKEQDRRNTVLAKNKNE
jgi:hypothetical protein